MFGLNLTRFFNRTIEYSIHVDYNKKLLDLSRVNNLKMKVKNEGVPNKLWILQLLQINILKQELF